MAGPCPRCIGSTVVIIPIIAGPTLTTTIVFQCVRCHWRQPTPPSPSHWRLSYGLYVRSLATLRKGHREGRRSIGTLKAIRTAQRALCLLRMFRQHAKVVV